MSWNFELQCAMWRNMIALPCFEWRSLWASWEKWYCVSLYPLLLVDDPPLYTAYTHAHTQLILTVVYSYEKVDDEDDDELTHGIKTLQLQKRVLYAQQTLVDTHAYTHLQTDRPLSFCAYTSKIVKYYLYKTTRGKDFTGKLTKAFSGYFDTFTTLFNVANILAYQQTNNSYFKNRYFLWTVKKIKSKT